MFVARTRRAPAAVFLHGRDVVFAEPVTGDGAGLGFGTIGVGVIVQPEFGLRGKPEADKQGEGREIAACAGVLPNK